MFQDNDSFLALHFPSYRGNMNVKTCVSAIPDATVRVSHVQLVDQRRHMVCEAIVYYATTRNYSGRRAV